MCVASNSLPVPDSPISSTRASERAAMRGLLDGALEGGARADHPGRLADQLPQALVLLAQADLLERVLHRQQHPVPPERLLQEIEGAGARGLHRFG